MRWRGFSVGWAGFALWMLAVAVGVVVLFVYETTPGQSQPALAAWPAETNCRLSAERPTLVMFVHPRCPCSRASISELAVLMTRCRGRLDAQVLFFQPATQPESWSQTDLWKEAARIPGVTVSADVDARQQHRFHASTSGEVFVYLPSGDLLFHGGITAGRGHAGDNLGRLALEDYLFGRDTESRRTPVYGCGLVSFNAEPSLELQPQECDAFAP